MEKTEFHTLWRTYKQRKTQMKKTIAIIAILTLAGCAKTSATDTIIDNAIFSTQAAIVTIKKTTTLEQCQAMAESQYKDDIRNLESAKVSAQRDIKAEQEKTLRWKLIAGFIGFILLASIARKVLK